MEFLSLSTVFLLAKKSFIAIINMTYSWRVRFAMIHTEREREDPSCQRHDIHVPTEMPPNEVRGRHPGMKIDRLIGILSVLLQEEKTTAPELAERFEVSGIAFSEDRDYAGCNRVKEDHQVLMRLMPHSRMR